MFSAKRYPEDLRLKAIEAVNNRRLQDPTDRTIFREVAQEFGIGEQSLRLWVKKSDSLAAGGDEDTGPDNPEAGRPLTQMQMEAELKRLRSKIDKLQNENALLKKAFVVFSSEWEK